MIEYEEFFVPLPVVRRLDGWDEDAAVEDHRGRQGVTEGHFRKTKISNLDENIVLRG